MGEAGTRPAAKHTSEPLARGSFLTQIARALQGENVDPRPGLSPAARKALDDPDPNRWVSEAVLVELLVESRRLVGPGRWQQVLRRETRAGIQTFFRVFIRYMPARMLFMSLPRMWGMTHTSGSIDVDWVTQSSLRVTYRDHPPLAHPTYRELCQVVLEVLLELNHARGEVRVLETGADRLVLQVALG